LINVERYAFCVTQKAYLSTLIKTAKENKIEKFQIPIDENHCYMIAKYGPVIRQSLMSDGLIRQSLHSFSVSNPEEEKEEETKDVQKEDEEEIQEGGKESNKPTVKWLPVRKDIDLLRLEKGEYTLADLLQTKAEPGSSAFLADHTPGGLPLYGGTFFGIFQDKEIIIRKGKFGRYAAWGEENRSIKCFGTRNVSNITLDEMIAVLAKPKRGSQKIAGDTSPSSSPLALSTPSIEQIPTAPPKKRRSPPAPKAPSHNLPANLTPITNNSPTPVTEPPKKRGRPPKKLDNNKIEN
jgi:hypothetical protein